MFLIPLRVEDAEVDRLPVVSIGIAALCVLVFLGTWVIPKNPTRLAPEAIRNAGEYWGKHPYLELPPKIVDGLRPPERAAYEAAHRKGLESTPDDPEQLAAEQKELDGMVAALFAQVESTPLWRWSMVPDRGFLQSGLLTHMFVHFGWLHLLGNLLFFYIAGLLLEDRWGRGAFAAFYLLGGLVAAAAQFSMNRHGHGMIAGASGAIAACMGAFAVRFPMRQVRMGYWIFWFLRGTFLVRAWMWGLVWVLLEWLQLHFDDGSAGVAFAAHVGGFAFGAGAAILFAVTGLERRQAAAVESKGLAYERHQGLDGAEEALARGDTAAAVQALQAVLAEAPDSVDANVMLVKLEVASDPAGAHARAERFLTRLLSRESPQAVHAVEELAGVLDAALLRPATAFRMGQVLEGGPDGLRPLAEQLFAASGSKPGPFAAKALVRAAQARLDAHGEARGALFYVERVRALPGVPADLLARAETLEQRAKSVLAREQELDPRFSGHAVELEGEPGPGAAPEPDPAFEEPAPEVEAPPPAAAEPSRTGARVTECRLGGMTRDALSLVLEGGGEAQVAIAKLLAVAVGVAAEPAPPPAPPRNILYTDLVTAWGDPARPAEVLRLKSSTLRLHNLYPGMQPQEAFAVFLAHLLEASGATALPDAAALKRGEYPRFPDVESFTRALYG